MDTESLRNRVIAIAGLIGVGKTHLARRLSELLGMPAIYEKTDGKMLELFYADRARHAFALQIQLLHERLAMQKHAAYSPSGAILDRSREEDWAFVQMLVAEGSIEPNHARVYENLCDELDKDLRAPDVIVFLRATPETCLERIRERNRGIESGVTIEYLQQLDAQYDRLIERLLDRGVNIITIDWTQFQDVETTATRIARALRTFKGQHIVL